MKLISMTIAPLSIYYPDFQKEISLSAQVCIQANQQCGLHEMLQHRIIKSGHWKMPYFPIKDGMERFLVTSERGILCCNSVNFMPLI